jgi:spore germination protein KC
LDVTVPIEESFVSAEVFKPKSKIKVSMKDSSMEVDIEVKGNMVINSFLISGVSDENYEEKIKSVEKNVNDMLTENTVESISKVQAIGSDIYGFGRILHEDNPKEWKEISDNWEDYFKTAKVNVKYDIKIVREGEIKRPSVKE